MKCSDRNQLENISSFIDFVALLIELHIWRNDIKYSPFQDASIDIKISPFEWSLELHIKCAFSFHRYKMILQQELHGEDFQKRTEFCNFIQRQNGVYSHILFSNEATFGSDSIVNRHNMHYWSIDNPHWVRHVVDHQVRWSINVWGGIIGEHVLGPHFFEGRLNGQMYLEFLRNECTDLIDQLPLNVVRNMIFQHLHISTIKW
jgi:hypothetical protein